MTELGTKLKGHREICEYLRIGTKTFYELLDRGLPVCVFGNAYRADAAQIDSWYANFVRRSQGNAQASS